MVASPPIEVSIRLYGWAAGESEVEITIPETSDLADMLRGASPAEASLVFGRLHRRLAAELADAFSTLDREPVTSSR